MTKLLGALAVIGTMCAPVHAASVRQVPAATENLQSNDGLDYIGRDPDPNVQFELERDPPADRQ